MRSTKSDSSAPHVPVRSDRSIYTSRPKTLGRARQSPVRQAAREDTSRIVGQTLERFHAAGKVAAVLCVSERLVRAFGEESDDHQLDVADVVAVHSAGHRVIAWGFWHDVEAFMLSVEGASGNSREEHLFAIQCAIGAAAEATRDGDAKKYRSAMHDLRRGASSALADEEADSK